MSPDEQMALLLGLMRQRIVPAMPSDGSLVPVLFLVSNTGMVQVTKTINHPAIRSAVRSVMDEIDSKAAPGRKESDA